VFNFKLTGGSSISGPNSPGEGHLIFYKNVDTPTTAGQTAFTSPGTFAVTAKTFHTWQNVPINDEGGYGFWVQQVNNDNTPLDIPVLAVVDINMMGFHPD
jgi:hypothetical protein